MEVLRTGYWAFWRSSPRHGVPARQAPKTLSKFSVNSAKNWWSDSRIKFSSANTRGWVGWGDSLEREDKCLLFDAKEKKKNQWRDVKLNDELEKCLWLQSSQDMIWGEQDCISTTQRKGMRWNRDVSWSICPCGNLSRVNHLRGCLELQAEWYSMIER